MRKVTIDYDPQTGTGAVYFDNVQLCDIILMDTQAETIRELVAERIKNRGAKKIQIQEKKRRAYHLLEKQIKAHFEDRCTCDLTEGGYGLCYAGQWLEDVIDSEQVIEQLEIREDNNG